MKRNFQNLTRLSFMTAIIIFGILLMVISSCKKEIKESATVESQAKAEKDFTQVNLVGDNDEYSPARIDPNLVNGWGIAISPNGFFWVSAEDKGVSLVY